jgi:hypothetical protein
VISTRRLALTGLVGPPVFAALIVLATAIEWDFLHDLCWSAGPFDTPDTPWPSSAARGDSGFLVVAAFFVLGVSVVAAAVALYRLLERRKTGPVLLALVGTGALAAAVRTDESSAGGGGPETWSGTVHAAGFTVLVFAVLPAMLVLAAQFRHVPSLRGLSRISLVAAAGALVCLVAFLPGGGIVFLFGFLAIVLAWLVVVAARAWSVTGPARSPSSSRV